MVDMPFKFGSVVSGTFFPSLVTHEEDTIQEVDEGY